MLENIETIKAANKLQNQIVYHIISKVLILVTQRKLADYLSDSPIEIDKLAAQLGYHPEAARRLFKLLETLNLLKITNEKLITSTYLTPYINQVYSEHYFGSFAAFNYFQNALQNNQECWSDAFGKPFYSYLKDNPEKLNEFQLYLEGTAECWLDFIPGIFDFSECEKVVDIGGGKGQLLAKIIENTFKNKNINIKGILFEKPEIISGAFSYLSSRNLVEKISLVKGDFLTDDLPKGDVYILCRVLLNWDDKDANIIIENCLKNITSGQKLIIVDFVIPPKKHKHYQRALLHDLNLLAVFGGKIRSLSDWKTLINSKGKRKAKYKIVDENLNPTLNVPMVIIEVEAC